jgi:chitinase
MKRNFLNILILSFFFPALSYGQSPALIGYFHNWNDVSAPYVQLDQVDARYNIIDISFATPQTGTQYKMEFSPDQVSQSTFITQIQTLQSQGRKVIISIGGATAPIVLNTTAQRDTFVSTMTSIINTYGFDGLDIDLEGNSLLTTGGTISAPIDAPVINLINGIKQIMANYQQQNNQKLMLTMAPETAYVQGGMSAYGGIWGAYLPVIHALRDSLDILHVQLYNSGTMYGIDNNVYTQGTADFIVAMCEAVIVGFNTTGGAFAGLPAGKVAAGLPACTAAAGGGYADTATVASAIRYLRGVGPQPGSYVLTNSSGYPDFRGMMTWSINWDAVSSCGVAYEYAQNFEDLFGGGTTTLPGLTASSPFTIYPNPASDLLSIETTEELQQIRIIDISGRVVLRTETEKQIDVSQLGSGIYQLELLTEKGTYREKLSILK